MKTTCLLILGLASTGMAQNDDALRAEKKLEAAADQVKANVMFNQQTFAFVSGQLVSGPPVKGAPYSAEAVNETIQTLADGNRIVQRSTSMQYRDTDGRERREETSAMGAIFITDPVAGARFTLHPESKQAEKGPMPAFAVTQNAGGNAYWYVNEGPLTALPGGRSGGPVTVAVSGRVAARAGRGAPEGVIRLNGEPLTIMTAGQAVTGASDAKTEQLGKMYVEGVQAEGTRITTTIPAGDIGNERPINIVDERWYSPDLQMTVMTKHTDPRMGETSFGLKNINRSSPPPYLFEVPSDYTVSAGGRGGGRSGGPVPPVRVPEPKK